MDERFCIKRFSENDKATYGVFCDNGVPFAVTLELPWLNNQRSISRIPAGTYKCERRMYHGGGYQTFEITNVPGRSNILIHKLNYIYETEGCIGVGEKFTEMNKDSKSSEIGESTEGFNEFMFKTEGLSVFNLEIRDVK